jgi:hypothetical protein
MKSPELNAGSVKCFTGKCNYLSGELGTGDIAKRWESLLKDAAILSNNPLQIVRFRGNKTPSERSNDRSIGFPRRRVNDASDINAQCTGGNAWRVDSPRPRYAGRPSLRHAGKRVKKRNFS